MPDYQPQVIEKKWQQRWADTGAFEVEIDRSRPKFYCLEMFAYPSGHAHVGHVRNYMIGDIVARLKRMQGFNVLHPFGWDAFGLPAENAAIKNNTHPETWTLENIAHMKGQLQRLGISYAWGREIATCLPDYYRWNQWLFLRMLERDLAYRRRSTVNWCPTCQTVLANEQVIDGKCWRCGTEVTQRDLEQWFLRITQYADELLDNTANLPDWPEKVLTMQQNWIGRSEGVRAKFPAVEPAGHAAREIEIFTTRIDTIYGATFVLLAPEHALVEEFAKESANPAEFRAKLDKFRAQDRLARMSGEVEKEGFDTGRKAINPFTKQEVPVWVANFVLADYGTGAIMAVPAHDERDGEFAMKYGLPIKHGRAAGGCAIWPEGRAQARAPTRAQGRMVDSGEFTGMRTEAAWQAMADFAEKNGIGQRTKQYRLKDWGVSRQRYWGTPIPVIHCPTDGVVAGAGRSAAGAAAEGRAVHRPRRFAAGADRRVRQRDVSEVRRSRAARDRHDGHVLRFVVVLLSLLRSAQRRTAVQAGRGPLLGPGRFLQRRRRARHPAPDLLALLHARVPRHRHGRARRAVRAPADAGHGVEGRQRHVQVEGERGRPRRHDPEVRRRRAAAVRDVRGAAGKGSGVGGHGPGRQLALPGARVALRRAARGDAGVDGRRRAISARSIWTRRIARCGGRRIRRSRASSPISIRASI